MIRILTVLVAMVVTLAATNPSQAARKMRVLSLADMNVIGEGVLSPALYITMPNSGTTNVLIRLTLPSDYKRNSIATLRLFFWTSGVDCTVGLEAVGANRWRIGSRFSNIGGPQSGFTAETAGPTPVPEVSQSLFYKDFKLAPVTIGNIAGQRSNDIISVMVGRAAFNSGDTCTQPLYLVSARLKYKTPN